MKKLNFVLLPMSVLLVACNDGDLAKLIAEAKAKATAEQQVKTEQQVNDVNPFTVTNSQIDSISIAQQQPEPEPVVIVSEPEQQPEPVTETVAVTFASTLIDPDGETVFTTQEISGAWTPRKGWIDSYSVGNRCYFHSTLDHNIGDVVVQTPYGPRTVEMVKQLIGNGPGLGDNPQYNDVQCGNGPANNFGDEDQGQCAGRIDQGHAGCGVIGPKWYFED